MPAGFASNNPTSFVLGSGWASYDRPSWSGSGTTSNSRAYGSVPVVPTTSGAQSGAINTNLANLAYLQNLATRTNQYQQNQLLDQYRAAFPNYDRNVAQASANILSNSRGQLTNDVVRNLRVASAERGVGGGTVGSDNLNAEYLRTMGLTMLDLQNLAQNQLNARVASTPVSRPFDISSFFITPGQEYSRNVSAATMAAAPDPRAAAEAAMRAATTGLGGVGSIGGGVYRPPTIPNLAGANGADTASSIVGRYQGPDYSGPYYGYTAPNANWSTGYTGYDYAPNTPAGYDFNYFGADANLMDPSTFGYNAG